MAYASSTTIASGSSANVVVPFPYIDQSHVHVKVNGVQTADNLLTWASASTIALPATPALGAAVMVYRVTPIATTLALLATQALYNPDDLNVVLTQLLYAAQEANDLGEANADELASIVSAANAAVALAQDSATLAHNDRLAADSDLSQITTLVAAVHTVTDLFVVHSKADLQAVIGGTGKAALLIMGLPYQNNASGKFFWSGDNLTTSVAADPLKGWFIPPLSDTTGASGAWVRDLKEGTYAHHAGAVYGTGQTSGTQDSNRAAIQASFDVLLYAGRPGNIARLAGGDLEYSGTLHFGYGDKSATMHWRGDGQVYRANAPGQPGCTLWHKGSASYQPLNFQFCTSSTVKNISFRGIFHGLLPDIINNPALSSGYVDVSVWNALTPGGTGQFTPYGITYDAFTGAQGASHYPDITFPAYVGALSQYGKNSSSQIKFESCQVSGMHVAFAFSPNGTGSGSDFHHVNNVQVIGCTYLFSCGNDQGRKLTAENLFYQNIHTLITTNTHGNQTGQVNGSIECAGSGLVQFFKAASISTMGGCEFKNVYAEILFRIGQVGSGSDPTGNGVRFSRGTLNYANDSFFGTAGSQIKGGDQVDVSFDNVQFTGFPFLLYFDTSLATNAGCRFNSAFDSGGSSQAYLSHAHNATGGFVTAGNTSNARPLTQDIQFCNRDLGTYARSFIRGRAEQYYFTTRAYCCPVWQHEAYRAESSSVDTSPRRPHLPRYSIAKTSLATVALSGTALTITQATVTYEEMMLNGQTPGCLIIDTGSESVFVIRSASGPTIGGAAATLTVVAELQNNMKLDGTLFNAFSTSVGNLQFVLANVYCDAGNTAGDFSTGSAAIANVGYYPGSGLVGLTTDLEAAAGDMSLTGYANGLYIASEARVVSKDTVAHTVTMAAAARRNATGFPMSWWIRTPPANSAVR